MKRLFATLFFLSVSAGSAGAQDFDKEVREYWRSDYTTAFEQLLPLAEQGNASAQFYVGSIHGIDDQISQYDEVAAVKWLKSAANLGLGDAQFVVGRWYIFGSSVPKDSVLAYMWLNLASGTTMWLSSVPEGKFKLSAKNAASLRDFIAKDMSRAAVEEA